MTSSTVRVARWLRGSHGFCALLVQFSTVEEEQPEEEQQPQAKVPSDLCAVVP